MPPAGIRDKGDSSHPERQAGKFLTVNLAAVFNPDHNNYQPIVVELADQAKITAPKAAKPSKIAKKAARRGASDWDGSATYHR